MLDKQQLTQLYLKDTSFVNLMTRRIFNVLLIANPYDAFMLEDDGRIDEKLFNEYAALSLRYPPRFTQVSTETEAWGELHRNSFDLIIVMPGTDNSDTFDIARGISLLLYSPPSATASQRASSTKTFPTSNTSSAGWETPICCSPSSN